MLGNTVYEKSNDETMSTSLRKILNNGFMLLNCFNRKKDYESLPFIQDKYPDIKIKISGINEAIIDGC